MGVNVEVTGLNELVGILNSAQANIPDVSYNMLVYVGMEIFEQSQEEVPYLTGALHDSGFIDTDGKETDQPSVSIGYTESYALPVHERLDLTHPKGKAKYLEDPMNQAAEKIEQYAAGIESQIFGSH